MNAENFLKELSDLLEKYNAVIGVDMDECSDTHGISGEKVVISIKEEGRSNYTDVFETHGWRIDASDFNRKVR